MPQCYFAMLVTLVVSSLALTELFSLSFCTSVVSLSFQLLTIFNTVASIVVYDFLLLPLFSDFDPVSYMYCGVTTLISLLSLESHEWLLARINVD